MRIAKIITFEWIRLFSTRRGVVALSGFFLIWTGILYFALLPAATLFSDARQTGLSEILLPRLGLQALQDWVVPELAIYWFICLYLLPFFVLIACADQTAPDRSRGTLRYWLLRSTRLELFLGRFLGQLILLAMVILITFLSVLVLIYANSPQLLPVAIEKSPLILTSFILLVMPYIAMMAFVSTLVSSARRATLLAVMILLGGALLFSWLQAQVSFELYLNQVLPGYQITQWVRSSDWQLLYLAYVPLAQTALFLILGIGIFCRKDL